MKPLKNSIPIRELQTLLRQWKSKGLTESTLLKVLELYLGLPNYMNEHGEYPEYFIYDLSASLKFRTAIMMLEAVRKSGSFGLKPGDNKLNISCFYSPLWKQAETNSVDSVAISAANSAATLLQNMQRENIYNINKISPSEINPQEEGKKFFHEINIHPTEKAEVLEPLIRYFQLQEAGVPREEACIDVVYLVNELLIPHFVAQEKFLKMKHNGRLAWLKNLLKSAHGKELMKRAAVSGRQRRALKQQKEQTELILNNRPLSPYEWTEPKSGIRFYEDELEGRLMIPADAPPRPSDTAFWNVIQKSWNS